jgi:hypothetical protein
MTEYKGVKYERRSDGWWTIRWPSGVRVTIAKPDEAAVKAMIDAAVSQ